jgi:hypothetical protein
MGRVPATRLAELSYQTAVRALEVQERAVDQLRARTGTLLAASSLTASFLGAQTIQHTSGLGTLGLLALVALALSIVSCTYILVPKRGFVFSLSAPAVYESLYEFTEDEQEIHRRLAYWLESYWIENQTIADGLGRWYAVAALALTLQLVLWCTSLASNFS